jgi:hypothetical protein
MFLSREAGSALLLVFTYCGFLVIALGVCIAVGYEADELGTGFGVTISIFAFFVSLWICWVAAVRVTAPRVATKRAELPRA